MIRNDVYPVALGAALLFLFSKLLPLTQLTIRNRAFASGNVLNLVAVGVSGVAAFLVFSSAFLLLGYFKQSDPTKAQAWLHQIAAQLLVLMGVIFVLNVMVGF